MGSLSHRFWLRDSFTEDLFYNEQPKKKKKGPIPGLEIPNLNWNPSKSQLNLFPNRAQQYITVSL